MSSIIEEIRAGMKRVDDKRDEGLSTPETIQRYDDIVYGNNAKAQVLDVYRLKSEVDKKLPVIVSVHGGGWVYGDKERYQFYCMSLAERGFAVVNFTYRLAPEYKFPASLEDTNSVFSWVLDNAEEYGFDTDNIFAVGDSAGGHILSLYTAMCTNSTLAESFSFNVPKGFAPKAIALNCGVYRFDMLGSINDQTTDLISAMLDSGNLDEQFELISSVNHVTSSYPPVFIMTSDGDFLKAQAPFMVDALTKSNVPFVYRYYTGTTDKLLHVFNLDVRMKEAEICNDDECEFFRKNMKA